MKGEVPVQSGNNHPTGAPTGTFPTRDGHINVAPTPTMWRRFCRALGRDDLIDHPDFASRQLRPRNRDKLNAIIQAITSQEDSKTLIERLNAASIPCGPVYRIDQAFADPQVRHLDVTETVMSKVLGAITLLGQPVSLSRTPSRLVRAAGEYDEHTEEVLGEFGYSSEEIGELRKCGAI